MCICVCVCMCGGGESCGDDHQTYMSMAASESGLVLISSSMSLSCSSVPSGARENSAARYSKSSLKLSFVACTERWMKGSKSRRTGCFGLAENES